MIAFPTEQERRERQCECGGCNYVVVRERVEVLPDLRKMSRHDRRAVEAIARKYGIEIGVNQATR